MKAFCVVHSTHNIHLKPRARRPTHLQVLLLDEGHPLGVLQPALRPLQRCLRRLQLVRPLLLRPLQRLHLLLQSGDRL